MNSATETLDTLRQQANDLYWTSEETVDQLASRLGMSRRSVYSAVQPLPAGATCARCSGMLVFANRTSRSANLANCPTCMVEVEVQPGETGAWSQTPAEMLAKAMDGDLSATEVPGPQNRWEAIKEDLAAVEPERAAKIGGAAALGVALGAAAVKAIKNRG